MASNIYDFKHLDVCFLRLYSDPRVFTFEKNTKTVDAEAVVPG
jgi:hypothetical protein